MHIYGASATLNLEPDASLRIRSRRHVEIVCLSGLLWVTQAGEVRDLFVASGESLQLAAAGLLLVTALEPSTLRTRELQASGSGWAWLGTWRPSRTGGAEPLALRH